MQIKHTQNRLHLVDFFRGIGIILMVVFHAAFNLNFWGVVDLEIWKGGWLLMARLVQFIFIFTTGMTLAIAYERGLEKHGRSKAIQRRLIHAVKLFVWALLITLITWVLFQEQMVKFGILHFYAVAIVLGLPFLQLRKWNLLVGVAVLLASIPLLKISVESLWFFPLGLKPPTFYSLDYFPLFPWFGLFLLGAGFASFREKLSFLKQSILKPLESAGRHSLIIYLLHQPILSAIVVIYVKLFS